MVVFFVVVVAAGGGGGCGGGCGGGGGGCCCCGGCCCGGGGDFAVSDVSDHRHGFIAPVNLSCYCCTCIHSLFPASPVNQTCVKVVS